MKYNVKKKGQEDRTADKKPIEMPINKVNGSRKQFPQSALLQKTNFSRYTLFSLDTLMQAVSHVWLLRWSYVLLLLTAAYLTRASRIDNKKLVKMFLY